jgi:hypothetical protein
MRPKLNAAVDAIVSTPHDENIQMKTHGKRNKDILVNNKR